MRIRWPFSLLLLVTVAGAQPDTADTYELLYAFRDSLRVWAQQPPHDNSAPPDSFVAAEWFPGADCVIGPDSVMGVKYPDTYGLHWRGLTGVFTAAGIDWTAAEAIPDTGNAGRDTVAAEPGSSELLAWLRTLPLPVAWRAPAPEHPDSVTWVLHGRDTDRIALPLTNTIAVLGRLAQGGLMRAGDISATEDGSMKLFALLTLPGSTRHHVLRWEEGDTVELHLYPFIPSDTVTDLFATPLEERDGHAPLPVGPGAKEEE